MASSDPFFDYWSKPDHPDDPAKVLAVAHAQAVRELDDLKSKGVSYLVPGKDSRGRWVPVYDDAHIDEIASLGTSIAQCSEKLKSISNDIEEFVSITDGKFWMSGLIGERSALYKRNAFCERHAAAMLKKALDKDMHTSPAVLMQRADIAEAYAAQAKAKEETAKPIAELDEKIGKLNEILDRYR
jgi:hypothetical protein